MPNHLINVTSPYLLQHAHNPVDWYPWSNVALQKALQEEKPIFLSIGYSACHWCHVMAHESFEDVTIAKFLNENFVSIKVDREERPDLDSVYMTALVTMTGQGGWPMSMFLAPEGQPFYGGTYFPPIRRYGLPSFMDVLSSLAQAWKLDRQNVYRIAAELTNQSTDHQSSVSPDSSPMEMDHILDQALSALIKSYDYPNGGWGKAPKFPAPMTIEFLLQQATRGHSEALDVARDVLHRMCRGGMYDLVGGGFHRYSTDNHWLVPHFEKMLYDNAQLSLVYLHAYSLTNDSQFRRVCEETLDFIQSELCHPQGGFFSSLDADSDGQEGLYYVWTADEIRQALGDPQLASIFLDAYQVSQRGNFEGKNILQKIASDEEMAPRYKMQPEEWIASLNHANQKLSEFRRKRIRPATDDKILTFWNALTLRSFAEAARILKRPDYLKIAQENASFILNFMHPSQRLMRSWREGHLSQSAFLEDYAAMIIALLTLYQADFNQRWFHAAEELASEMLLLFPSTEVGFYDTGIDQEKILLRPRQTQDNAVPCGNSMAAYALLLLSAYNPNNNWQTLAENSIRSISSLLGKHPDAFSYWLQAVDLAAGPLYQVTIVVPHGHEDWSKWIEFASGSYTPRMVLTACFFPFPQDRLACFDDRPPVNDQITAYICKGTVCSLPITNFKEFEKHYLK